ncbi:MAG: hypothetical protein Q4D05_09115 [Acinetobacter sp.]|nr:hypothetical protein [Acinetobacter sp.]
MKIVVIGFVIIALLIVIAAFIFSFKQLRRIQKTAQQQPHLNQEHRIRQRHPAIERELNDIVKQKQALQQRKKSAKK